MGFWSQLNTGNLEREIFGQSLITRHIKQNTASC